MAVGGFTVGAAFTAPACPDKKDVLFYVETFTGTLKEVLLLVPNLAEPINRAIKFADIFTKAYNDGKFEDAITAFENMAGVFQEIYDVAGGMNASVKIALAVAGVAMRAIAVLLKSHESEPAVAAVVKARRMGSDAQAKQIALIDQLANAESIEAAFKSVKVQK